MKIAFLTDSQSLALQEILRDNDDAALQQRAQVLLLLDHGETPDQLSLQFGLAVEGIEALFGSFQSKGIDAILELGKSSDISFLNSSTKANIVDKFAKQKSPGILTNDTLSEAGRKILRFQFARMISHEPGTRLGTDIEELHDMRVATRRMRVAFEILGEYFKNKEIKPFKKGLRDTARALGRVRDLDVFLTEINGYLESLPEDERQNYEEFLSLWREKHKKARLRLLHFLDSDQYQVFIQEFDQFLNAPVKRSRQRKNIKPNKVRDIAPIIIYERLAVVRAYDMVLGDASIEELHSLRLQLKKLRYTVEYFSDVLGSESKKVIRNIKVLQDHLGNLNDADMACQIANEFIIKLEKKQISLPIQKRLNPEPIIKYLAAKYNERHNLIITFPETWPTILGKEFSEMLAKAISVI